MGHGARGLQRRRQCLGLFPVRAGARQGLSLGRGRTRWILRPKQLLCFGLALWNGQDPILKERPFGLTNEQGNHGEDVKDYWYYVDDTPTHSYMQICTSYPQAAFPYADLIHDQRRPRAGTTVNSALRHRHPRRAKLLRRHRQYAKADHDDICIEHHRRQSRPRHGTAAHPPDRLVPQHLGLGRRTQDKPSIELIPQAGGPAIRCTHSELGSHVLAADGDPTVLFTDNETNAVALFGADRNPLGVHQGRDRQPRRARPSDDRRARPAHKAAFWYRFDAVPAGGEVSVRLRLSASGAAAARCRCGADRSSGRGRRLLPRRAAAMQSTHRAGTVARRAFAGLLWSTKALPVRRRPLAGR